MNACLEREAPRYLIRDRDAIFGREFDRKVESLGIRQIRTPIRAPKANSIAERFIGTLRRECLDYVFVLNDQHLQKLLDEFEDYYNQHRPHRSLEHRSPCGQASFPTGPPRGEITAEPILGRLHHIYRRAA